MADTQLDLHGKTWREAQDEFIAFYNAALGRGGGGSGVTLTVVHGYGSTGEGGVLRKRMRAYLDRLGDYLEYTPGERYGRQSRLHLHSAAEAHPRPRRRARLGNPRILPDGKDAQQDNRQIPPARAAQDAKRHPRAGTSWAAGQANQQAGDDGVGGGVD